jgi:cyclopropane fatty-acyl-phospholipid synthase-like methyltransferase
MNAEQLQRFFNTPEPFLDPQNGYKERSVQWFENTILNDFLKLQLPSPLLDAGCGYGYFTRRYAMHYQDVIAIDFSAERVEGAKRVNSAPNITYICADLTVPGLIIPKPAKSIVTSAVVQHIPPERRGNVFQNLHSVSEKGAVMVMYDSIGEGWDGFYGPINPAWIRTQLTASWSLRSVDYCFDALQGEKIHRLILDRA